MSMIVKVKNTFINVEVHDELSRKERPHSWPLANSASVSRGGASFCPDSATRGRRKKPTSRDRRLSVPTRRASAYEIAPPIKLCDKVGDKVVDLAAAPLEATVNDAASDIGMVAPKAVREGAWHLCNVARGVKSRLVQEAFRQLSGRPAHGPGSRTIVGKAAKASASAAVPSMASSRTHDITRGYDANAVVKEASDTFPGGSVEHVATHPRVAPDSHRRRRSSEKKRTRLASGKTWRARLRSAPVLASIVLALALLCGYLGWVSEGWQNSPRVEAAAGDHQALDATTLQAFDEAVEGVSGLMRRLDALQEHLELTGNHADLTESRLLRKRFVELLHGLQSATVTGANLLRAAEDGRVYAFHKDLALYVARIERELDIRGPAPHIGLNPPFGLGGRGILGTSSLGSLEGLGASTLARTSAASNTPTPPTSFGWSGLGNRATAEKVGPIKSPRIQNAMRAIVKGMNRFAAVQPQLKGLAKDVFLEIASRAESLDEVLFELQRQGHELQGLAASGGLSAARLEEEGQQFVVRLENFVSTQADFLHEVEEVTRTRHLHGGYVAYRPKDLR